MNKKGYIRTLEAIIAIVIVLTFTYSVMPKEEVEQYATPYIVQSAQDYILAEVQQNSSYRNLISGYTFVLDADLIQGATGLEKINSLIQSYVPPGYDCTALICKKTTCVSNALPAKNVFMSDVIITPSNINNPPRIVRIWMWEKK